MDSVRHQRLQDEALSHMDALYRTALRMTRNRLDAEDLVQDTYVKAMRGLEGHHEGAFQKAWLFRILANAYIDRYRRRQKKPTELPLLDHDGQEPGALKVEEPWRKSDPADRWRRDPDRVLRGAVSDEVKEAVDGLPDILRLTIVLRDVEGFTYEEVASILDVPIGTVMSRLHRARKQLKRRLLEYAVETGYATSPA